jgi:hypothetical protein
MRICDDKPQPQSKKSKRNLSLAYHYLKIAELHREAENRNQTLEQAERLAEAFPKRACAIFWLSGGEIQAQQNSKDSGKRHNLENSWFRLRRYSKRSAPIGC